MKNNKYEIKATSQFKKDLKIIQKRKLNIQLLNVILSLIGYLSIKKTMLL